MDHVGDFASAFCIRENQEENPSSQLVVNAKPRLGLCHPAGRLFRVAYHR